MPVWNQILLQNSSSVSMYLISSLHDHVMVVVILIVSLVLYMISFILLENSINRFFHKNELLELVWTILPGLLIVGLAMPSLYSLYLMEESFSPVVTFKAIGHQWYWSYEFSDFKEISFDSYLVPQSSTARLLEVDNNLVIPVNTQIRMTTTSADVIHSWTIPSIGVKVDSVPGRLNQSFFSINQVGLSYGQCSEICGSFHSFMPICIETVKEKDFLNWILEFFNQ